MSQPKVSVVITTSTDRKYYLENALLSVFRQTYRNIEVIIVNDSSDDLDYLTSILPSSISLRVIKTPVINSGANVARNIGVEHSDGEFIAFLDDDDIWFENKLEEQISLFTDSTVAVLSSFNYLSDGAISQRKKINSSLVSIDELKYGNPYCGMSGIIVRANVFDHILFDELLPCGQDWDFLMSSINLGRIIFTSEPLFLYRVNSSNSITSKVSNLTFREHLNRLHSAIKWRKTIGEECFNKRVYEQLFSNFYHKRFKIFIFTYFVKNHGIISFLRLTIKRILRIIK